MTFNLTGSRTKKAHNSPSKKWKQSTIRLGAVGFFGKVKNNTMNKAQTLLASDAHCTAFNCQLSSII